MRQVLNLARRGAGHTSPNPLVGAVVVRGEEAVGTGYHQVAGGPHAEVIALDKAGERARGASLYVNLEPCSHQGRTPPCTKLIITSGVGRVVSAMEDPNPKVSGRGFQLLREAGIQVKTGVLEQEARRLNEAYIKHITTGYPLVAVKTALTLDGKIATRTGDSRWITGEKSRRYVHRLRGQFDAVMIGIGTVLADNPLLTTRFGEGRDALRIVVDSKARLPLGAGLINSSPTASAILATTELADPDRCRRLKEQGVNILTLPSREKRVDLRALFEKLGKRGVTSVLVEGGGRLNYSLLEQGLVDKLLLFVAPIIFGGKDAPTAFNGSGIDRIADAWRFEQVELKRLQQDLLVIGYPERKR